MLVSIESFTCQHDLMLYEYFDFDIIENEKQLVICLITKIKPSLMNLSNYNTPLPL